MKKGFTLIELLIVIAIIGILAVIVFASVNGARIKARNVAAQSDVVEMGKAIEQYQDTYGGNIVQAATANDATDIAGGTYGGDGLNGTNEVPTGSGFLSIFNNVVYPLNLQASQSSNYYYIYKTSTNDALHTTSTDPSAITYLICTNLKSLTLGADTWFYISGGSKFDDQASCPAAP